MTLLEIIQEMCKRLGLPVPQVVSSSQDTTYLQMIGLLNEVLTDLITDRVWSVLHKEAYFTSNGLEVLGLIDQLAPYGFQHMLNGTFMDRTTTLPIMGPLSAEEWQLAQSRPSAGIYTQFRFRGKQLSTYPIISSGHILTFEYASKFSVLSEDRITYKAFFSNDTDICQLDDSLLLAGLKWRWRKEKGLSYGEDFKTYEILVASTFSHDGGHKVLYQDSCSADIGPGIFVPSGNWRI